MESDSSSARQIWLGLALFLLWVLGIGLGLAKGVPHSLQMTGWLIFAAYLVGGSLYLILRSDRKGRHFGEIGLLPPRLRRWVLDEHDPDPVAKR